MYLRKVVISYRSAATPFFVTFKASAKVGSGLLTLPFSSPSSTICNDPSNMHKIVKTLPSSSYLWLHSGESQEAGKLRRNLLVQVVFQGLKFEKIGVKSFNLKCHTSWILVATRDVLNCVPEIRRTRNDLRYPNQMC